MSEQKFTKKERIRSRTEYTEIFNQGKKTYSSNLIIFCRANGENYTRVGITASRKVGKAVVRNRVKRFLREYYRQHKSYFATSYDYSLVVRQGFSQLPKKKADEQLAALLKRCNQTLKQK